MSLFGKYETINIMGGEDSKFDVEVFNRTERKNFVPTDYLKWQESQKKLLKQAKSGKVTNSRESKFRKEISLRATEKHLKNERDKTVKTIENKYSLVLLALTACGIAATLGCVSMNNNEVLQGIEELGSGLVGGGAIIGSSCKCLKRLKKTDESIRKINKIKRDSNII